MGSEAEPPATRPDFATRRATCVPQQRQTISRLCEVCIYVCEMGTWVDDVQEPEISSLYVTRAILFSLLTDQVQEHEAQAIRAIAPLRSGLHQAGGCATASAPDDPCRGTPHSQASPSTQFSWSPSWATAGGRGTATSAHQSPRCGAG